MRKCFLPHDYASHGKMWFSNLTMTQRVAASERLRQATLLLLLLLTQS
jgi:hypothetical protein